MGGRREMKEGKRKGRKKKTPEFSPSFHLNSKVIPQTSTISNFFFLFTHTREGRPKGNKSDDE